MQNFHLDRLSFWIGFLIASLLWWILSRIKGWFPNITEYFKKRAETARQKSLSGIELDLRQETLKRTQRLHVTNSLFSLDEIVIQPKFLAPPVFIEPNTPPPPETIANQIIPYLPDWPEFGARFGIQTLTFPELLKNNVHIAIIGQPGAGKTTALAYWASLIAKRDPAAENLVDYFPVFMHILDLRYKSAQNQDPVDIFIKSFAAQAPLLLQSRAASLIRSLLKQGKILFLLDGLDELSPNSLPDACTFLNSLLTKNPNILLVTTTSADYLDGLSNIGIYPIALAAWSNLEIQEYIQKWEKLWSELILPEISQQTKNELINPRLITNWLSGDSLILSPLEWTLWLWAAYSGDMTGPTVMQSIDSYIWRSTNGAIPLSAIENLAYQMCLQDNSSLTYGETEKILTKFHPHKPTESTAESKSDESIPAQAEPTSSKRGSKKEKRISSGDRAISIMLENGLMVEHLNDQIQFNNPQILGYLASFAASSETPLDLKSNLYWSAKIAALHFMAAQNKNSTIIDELLQGDCPPLHRNLLMVCRWLRDIPPSASFRANLLRQLATLLPSESFPLGLRTRLIAALSMSNDPSISMLYKQLIIAQSEYVRMLGALGFGAIRDSKSVNDLIGLFNDPVAEVRNAACLAIGAFGNLQAAEIIVDVLMHGDEGLRLTAAECLAKSLPEGHEVLKEAIELEDILVRRAVVFGLSQIRELWVISLLEKVTIQDAQWVVRNGASQALEALQQPNPSIPHYLPDPADTPWLITFASKQGLGVSPNQPATDILLRALEAGDADEQVASLHYLRQTQEDRVMLELFKFIYGRQLPVREAAYNALWYLAISGVTIPSPEKFGYG